MFTGIINSIGTIESVQKPGDLALTIACDFAAELRVGESVSCNGACLTIVEKTPTDFTVTLSAETLERTALRWDDGDKVNLERSLKLGDRLDGHMVTGHIDGIATLKKIYISGDSRIFELETPPGLSRFIAEKGSVTLDGVSLTVNKVENHCFFVNIILHTWQVTTLGQRKSGDALNLEIDIMARYAARLLEK